MARVAGVHNPNWGGKRPNSGPKNKKKANSHTADQAPPAQPRTPMFSAESVQAIIEAMQLSGTRRTPRPRTLDWCPFRIDGRDGCEIFPPHARPKNKNLHMAMDNALQQNTQWAAQAWMAGGLLSDVVSEGLLFLGYPYLAQLAQRPEFRLIAEIRAEEMVRQWTEFRGTQDESTKQEGSQVVPNEEDQQRELERELAGEPPRKDSRNKEIEAKIQELDDFGRELKVRDWFKVAAAQDGFFGISHLHLRLKNADVDNPQDPELKSDIGNGRNDVSLQKLQKGCLLGMQTIEPIWVYPTTYNASNPLKTSWYDPQVWYVMGTEIHKSRLLTFIGRPVPDILKPAYAFGGLSMTQMAQPYVDIWLRTRESVGEIIHAFSVMVLATNLATTTMPGGSGGGNGDVVARVNLFNMLRDNQGAFVIDKATEDFKNVSAPLGGLDHLQAQAQEHLCSVARIPLVKFTGISPTGLNATNEFEMQAFYDTVHGSQEQLFRAHLTTVYDIMQIHLWGKRDPDITFDFKPLREVTPLEKAGIRLQVTQSDAQLVDLGVISQEELRNKIVHDPDSGFEGLDPEELPDLLQEEEAGFIPEESGTGLRGLAELEQEKPQEGAAPEEQQQQEQPQLSPEQLKAIQAELLARGGGDEALDAEDPVWGAIAEAVRRKVPAKAKAKPKAKPKAQDVGPPTPYQAYRHAVVTAGGEAPSEEDFRKALREEDFDT
jgi:phage-related protein (TIGR01555 family)